MCQRRRELVVAGERCRCLIGRHGCGKADACSTVCVAACVVPNGAADCLWTNEERITPLPRNVRVPAAVIARSFSALGGQFIVGMSWCSSRR